MALDFLRGMQSATPIRDTGMEGMQQAAIRDYGSELRQRRAVSDLQGLISGDPEAQMRLAAIGIGGPPLTEEQRALRKEDRALRKEKFAWEKEEAEKGREFRSTEAKKSRTAADERLSKQLGFRRSQAEIDRAVKERHRAEDISERRRTREEDRQTEKDRFDYQKKMDATLEGYRARREEREMQDHALRQAMDKYKYQKLQQGEAALPKVVMDFVSKYSDPMPKEKSLGADYRRGNRDYERDLHDYQKRVLQNAQQLKSLVDMGYEVDDALDAVFPTQRMQEAIQEQVQIQQAKALAEQRAMMALEQEAAKARQQQERKKARPNQAVTSGKSGGGLWDLFKKLPGASDVSPGAYEIFR